MNAPILGDVIKCQECGHQSRSISRGCSYCGYGAMNPIPEPTFKQLMETTVTEKALHIQQAEGLEQLAAMLREHPELADGLRSGPFDRILAYVGHLDDPVAAMGAFARAGVSHRAKVTKDYDDRWGAVDITFGPVGLHVYADREQVCERVVVGTETVTKTVKDPDALAAVPEVEVIETVEKVEWRCTPLLASTRDGA